MRTAKFGWGAALLAATGIAAANAPQSAVEHAFGPDPKQRLDLQRPLSDDPAPVLVFVHGGGWAIGDKARSAHMKADWATARGWAFASINYRLVPDATVEQQAEDVARSLAWLRANATREGLDPDRIVIMGHSAGAHLAALVATDVRYLGDAGVPVSALRGVVLLDGAGYDVPAQMANAGLFAAGMYRRAFGEDVARQRALSPTHHASAPNAGNWLIMPVARRRDSRAQSEGLATALKQAGYGARVVPVPGESHSSLNRGLGEDGDFATDELARFLASL